MSVPRTLRGPRLVMIPGTPQLLRAELGGTDSLSAQLRVRVPEDWPPDLYDEPAMRWSLDWLIAHPEGAGWSLYYLVLDDPDPVAVGIAGFKGMPDADGTVELGYSVIAAYRRRGLAAEAVRVLLDFAFADTAVQRVTAETLPELEPSIGVLVKCGFEFVGAGSEEGVIRYAIERAAYGATA